MHGLSSNRLRMKSGAAISISNNIYFVDGNKTGVGSRLFVFDADVNAWTQKASMPTPRSGAKLVWFENRIWAVGGYHSVAVESYDVVTDTWRSETDLPSIRGGHISWVAGGKIFVLGKWGGPTDVILEYDPNLDQWSEHSRFPIIIGEASCTVLDGMVYVVGGATAPATEEGGNPAYSNKVFAADITPPMDLYFRDSNVSGSVTLNMLSLEVREKLLGDRSALDPVGLVSALPLGKLIQLSKLRKKCQSFWVQSSGSKFQESPPTFDFQNGLVLVPLMVMLPICRVMETMAP